MRPIDADALMKSLTGVEVEWYIADDGTIGDTYDTSTVVDIIQEQPTVEAEPVRHGRWVDTELMIPTVACSKCGGRVRAEFTNPSRSRRVYNYCPNCGAKMSGERRDNDATD